MLAMNPSVALTMFTGDDFAQPYTLLKNGVVTDLSTASIAAAIVDKDGNLVVGPVVQSNAAQGANWAQAVVVVEFSSAETALITKAGMYAIEVQVTLGGKKTTWPRQSVQVILGVIA